MEIQNINKNWFFERINKIIMSLAKNKEEEKVLISKRKRGHQIPWTSRV